MVEHFQSLHYVENKRSWEDGPASESVLVLQGVLHRKCKPRVQNLFTPTTLWIAPQCGNTALQSHYERMKLLLKTLPQIQVSGSQQISLIKKHSTELVFLIHAIHYTLMRYSVQFHDLRHKSCTMKRATFHGSNLTDKNHV